MKMYQLRRLIVENGNVEKVAPEHLLWTLFFLRTYNTEEVLASMIGHSEKMVRKWIWTVVQKLAEVDSLVSKILREMIFMFSKTYSTIFKKDLLGQ